MDYISRAIEAVLQESLALFPIVLISGARQVGKSTLSKSLSGYDYITLDNTLTRERADSNPDQFIRNIKTPVIIDEIQKSPSLLPAIKESVDNNRAGGRFVLTGSANIFTLKTVKETLVGRLVQLELQPLSQKEIYGGANLDFEILRNSPKDLPINKDTGRSDIIRAIITGGYPERYKLRNNLRLQSAWTDTYISSYIDSDVMSINEIRNLNAFHQLYRILAIQSASALNKNSLARDIKLSHPTLNAYLEILTQTYQIMWLPSWATNLGKRLVKNSKMFFADTGMLSHLLNIYDENSFNNSYLNGSIVETFVLSELLKSVKSRILSERFSFFRTEDGKEIDFIVEGAGRPIAIEVKASESVRPDDFKHIRYLQKNKPELNFQGVVFYMGGETVVFSENCTAVPISTLL